MATTLAGLATSGQVGNLTAPNNAGISATAMVVNAMSTNGVLLSATQSLYAPAKAGDEMTLTVAYDAAKSAASQTSVNALGTPQQAGTKYAVSWNWSDVSGSQPSFVASNMVSLAGIATGVEVAAAQDAITAALGSLSITLSGDEITALAAAIAGDITVTGLTDTQNTWLESAYTHTEYIVNGTPIIILPPFPLPGYGYCSTGDINAYWGQQNVLKWANMNNLDPTSDQGLADIAAFTQNAIVKATAEIDEVMRGGPYLLPLTPQDASTAVSLADVCSRIAGILLHNARGLEDENGAFTACRKDMDARLKEWRNPQIGRRLNCQTASAAAACNVPTTSPRRQRDWRGSIPLPPDSPLIP
jgi:hypothetical protein